MLKGSTQSTVLAFPKVYQAPDSETLLMSVFISSTCFWPSGAAQQQLGFQNFTSGSVRMWRNVQEAQSNYLLHMVRLSIRPCVEKMQEALSCCVPHKLSNAHSVQKYKMAALSQNKKGPVTSLACLFPGFICLVSLHKLSVCKISSFQWCKHLFYLLILSKHTCIPLISHRSYKHVHKSHVSSRRPNDRVIALMSMATSN